MKLNEAIGTLGSDRAARTAAQCAQELGINWEHGAKHVFQVIVNDHTRIPGNIGSTADNEATAINKWVIKYKTGHDERASKRISKNPGTMTDPIIEKIINARLPSLEEKDLEKINSAHRLAMSAENILGLILEEYLAGQLTPFGWHCAWGNTVKAVDFVNENGDLLQIKNRSNTENSSSSAVREGTAIKKWFRVNASTGGYMWDELNEICGTSLSEDQFVAFAIDTLRRNPACLAVENENAWLRIGARKQPRE